MSRRRSRTPPRRDRSPPRRSDDRGSRRDRSPPRRSDRRSPDRRSGDRSDRDRKYNIRDKSRSRERRRSDRDRSRSRDRKRPRSRSTSRDRKRKRSNERDQKEKKLEETPQEFSFNAAQVSSRLCEVFASQSKVMRPEWITECFNPKVQLVNLRFGPPNDTVILEGSTLIEKIIDCPSRKSDSVKQVFISSPSSSTSFSLHFYKATSSPGLCPSGVEADKSLPTLVLYRVVKNQIDKIWVTADEDDLISNLKAKKDDLLAGSFWTAVTDAVTRDLQGTIEFVYNNYEKTEDSAGFGLGNSSVQETWELKTN